jgi:hypothetical protein
MKKIFTLILLFCFSIAFTNVTAQNSKPVVGEWKYKVAQAPYGYDTGVISLKEVEKKLTGEIIFDSGYKVKLQSVDFKNDTLRVGVYVDSEYVNILSRVKGKKLEGTVDSSMGKMDLTAEKLEKK